MDDFAITVTSNSAKSNYKKLERIALELMSRAKEAAISFDVSKTELIHFHSKRTTIEVYKLYFSNIKANSSFLSSRH